MTIKRCSWVTDEEIYIKYHDEEWGVPTHDDQELFEMLVLESFQAGLSWITILKKRENFRKAFDNFDYMKISEYKEDKVNELKENKGIIRHKGKINAAINNAKIFMEIQNEFESFDSYIWGFSNGKIIKAEFKTESELSKTISKDLKKRGMKFVGPTIVYSYLESIGIIDNHQKSCFKFNKTD
ncbi:MULTISPECIES: DNA-3-methyladenine glycosylase I [Methanobrevibacter]|uniref:DNA-3-methyladenine glycosylase I n=1 Tax=Methanobrevibacter gottschalkii DSM 11977 TaxID=1122229 RepID=A0A3N5BRS4_9EURY|nr:MULTISPECIES: DNA-3-methyladenine glycosylase I [Methanobrevibacter]OED01012.1 DNA-3-methyladenine glycosylase [Methanobrevibacter sp. A27]RPF50202.1 DNA-3-methyladenine glycosylase I [Methanobrevibacter gottschalkii DSM 11977]